MAKRMINLDTKEIAEILRYIPEGHCDALRKKLTSNMKTIKVRSAKNKGMKLQKDFAEQLANTLGLFYSQTDDSADISSRTCGLSGEDIILRNAAKTRIPFSFEAKATESLDLVKAISQAKANMNGKYWAVIHRRKSLAEDIVIIPMEAFFSMLQKGGY